MRREQDTKQDMNFDLMEGGLSYQLPRSLYPLKRRVLARKEEEKMCRNKCDVKQTATRKEEMSQRGKHVCHPLSKNKEPRRNTTKTDRETRRSILQNGKDYAHACRTSGSCVIVYSSPLHTSPSADLPPKEIAGSPSLNH